jgi:ATP-dependent helicase Lhr and Lhr-like helicase
VQMRRMLPESVLEEVGGLDATAIAQVREEAWPDVRDADELHDVLHTLVALPESGRDFSTEQWKFHFDRLVGEGRAASAVNSGRIYWVAAERAKTFSALFPEARFAQELVDLETTVPTRDDALLTTVTGWMSHLGPTTATQLGETLGIGASEISNALLRMEASGTVLRGNFSGAAVPTQAAETEWCERRLLARIHRLTVVTLRKQIEPVTAAQFMQWLLRWQHAAAGTQVAGERGTLEVLRQLQGFEIPANAWERQVLARRIVDYDPKWLDQLCLTGAVGWGRLSPHPATLEYAATNHGTGPQGGAAPRQRRVIPTSVAPITFFIREDADWMTPRHPGAEQAANNGLSHVAQMVLDFLRQRGASFFADIVRGTDKLKAEIETGLWELVAAGLVTADGFDNLRSLIDPKRRAGQGSGRTARPRHNAGRWALLHTDEVVERQQAVEAACWMLLRRYGIVVRDVLAREANLPPWRELLAGFRRLEDRGEIRGGRFVDGFLGEQFALPVAVESVRAMRKLDPTPGTITLSAADPLNLVGILVPGERVPAISGNSVTFRDGAAVPMPAVASAGDEAVAS